MLSRFLKNSSNYKPFVPLPYRGTTVRFPSLQLIKPTILSVVFLFVFSGFEAKAGVILGALQTSSGQSSKNFSNPKGLAQSFYYANNFTLTGIKLNLYNTSTSNPGNYWVYLYTNGLDGTKTELATGTWASLWGTNSSNVVSITGLNYNLLQNTTYWIGVTTDTTGTARNWSTFDNHFGNGTAYTNTATYNGTSWSTQAGSSTNAMGMEILGTVAAVPEPSTLILTSVTLTFGAFCVWWKRRRNNPAQATPTVC